jgi:hypothetical protein
MDSLDAERRSADTRYIGHLDQEEVVQKLLRKDPRLAGLFVSKHNWFAGAGHIIDTSTTLKELVITCLDAGEEEDHWFNELCTSLVRNETIESMVLCIQNERFPGLDGLIPFLKNIRPLRNFCVDGCPLPMSVVLALSKRENDLLNRIVIDRVDATDEVTASFFSMLNGKNCLSVLKYCNNYIQRAGCTALSNWLRNPENKTECLDLQNNRFDDNCIAILGNGLVLNNNLRTLVLSGNYLGSATGSIFLSAIISSPSCKLENLHLFWTGMCDEGLSCLGNALTVNKSITFMDISGNATITNAGWRGLTNYLRHPQSTLKEIGLNNCGITNDVAGEIISALADNVCLERLVLRDDELSTDKVLSDILFVILDKTSIDRTFCSNHTFHKIEIDLFRTSNGGQENFRILHYLSMNEKENKADVARQKILDHHFTRSETDIRAFADMPEAVLPFAIEWIGRDRQDRSLSLMHLFVRGFPTLFDVRDKPCAAGLKRKYME